MQLTLIHLMEIHAVVHFFALVVLLKEYVQVALQIMGILLPKTHATCVKMGFIHLAEILVVLLVRVGAKLAIIMQLFAITAV